LIERLARDPRPHLLILDGLESAQIQDRRRGTPGRLTDPALRKLLTRIASGLGASRALLVSRLPLTDLQYCCSYRSIVLADLSEPEAAELIGALGPDPATDPARPIERFGTHPLSLLLGVACLLEFGPSLDEPMTPEQIPDDPLAERIAEILAHYERCLPPLERDLLAVLAALPSDASLGPSAMWRKADRRWPARSPGSGRNGSDLHWSDCTVWVWSPVPAPPAIGCMP
jgi:hypothetical protein